MKNIEKKGGFTVLELVVSIFLIAVVLGTALLLMAANLNILDRANEMMVANALAQYTLEDVRNIDFPPIYHDKQQQFGDRPVDAAALPDEVYKGPGDVDGSDHQAAGNWIPGDFPEELDNHYLVRRYNFRYDSSGELLTDATVGDTGLAMRHRVDVYILRRRDGSVILQDSIYISRDGQF